MSQDSVSSVSSTGSVSVQVRKSVSLSEACPAPSGAQVSAFEKAAGMTIAEIKAVVTAISGGSKKHRKHRKGRRHRGGVTPTNASKKQKLAAGCLTVIALAIAAGVSAGAVVWILNITGYFAALNQAVTIAGAKVAGCGTIEGIAAKQALHATAVKVLGATTAKAANILTCAEAITEVQTVMEALASAKWVAGLKAMIPATGVASFTWTPVYTHILTWFPDPDSIDITVDVDSCGGGTQPKITSHFKPHDQGGGRRRRRRTHRRHRRKRRRTKRRRRKTRNRRRTKRRRTRRRRR